MNIISFSLYGADPLYCEGALSNAILANEVYPGWRCRFYVDDRVPEKYTKELENMQCEVIPVRKTLGPLYGRFWRFWVASDPNVDRFIVRDVDSRLNTREKAAVDTWIQSKKSYHIMRDCFYHKKRVLSGMWGAVGGVLPNIADLIDEWGQYDRAGQNDQFMSEVVYPLMKNDYICHDSMGHFEDATPFPPHAHLNGTSYVGEIVDLDRTELDVWRRVGELSDQYLLALEYARSLLAEREVLLASASWRLTSPLRSVAAKMRALGTRQRAGRGGAPGFRPQAGPSVI
jgi:hypothetical protein